MRLKNKLWNNTLAHYRSEKIWTAEWIFVAITSLIAIVAFFYIDLSSLTVWSTNLLDVIFDGNLRDFYAYTAENQYGVAHRFAGMDIFSLIPHAVWNIPIWIAQRFFGIVIVQSEICLIWSKLFFVALLGATCLLAYKISMMLDPVKSRAQMVCFLTLSSVFVYTGVYYAGQNDMLFIFLGMLAVYYLLKDRKWLFIVFSGLAITAKPFFLFVYIALLLFSEKNFLKIFGKLVLALGFMLPCKILFWGAPMYAESMDAGPGLRMIKEFLSAGYATGLGNVALVVIGLLILYLIAYLKVPENEGQRFQYIIYFATAAYILIAVCTHVQFYRPVFLMPLLALMMVHNKRFFNLSLLMETVAGFSYTLCKLFIEKSYVYTVGSVGSFLEKITGRSAQGTYMGLGDYVEQVRSGALIFFPFLTSAFVFCMIGLLVINFPAFQPKKVPNLERHDRWLMWVRMLVPVFFMATLFFFCFYVAKIS